MRALSPSTAAALAACLLAAGCQSPDVGQECNLGITDPTYESATQCSSQAGDYFESGNAACDNLVCIRTVVQKGCAGDPAKFLVARSGHSVPSYCSKPCVSDDDCFKSETGLVCRPIVLDQNFLATLDPAIRQIYLGDVAASSYCATPAVP